MSALIIVDFQHDFIDGSLAVTNANSIIPTIQKLINRGNWKLVIVSRDCHPPHHISFASTHNKEPFNKIEINGKSQELWPDHCIVASRGYQLHNTIRQSLDNSSLNIHYVEKGCDVDKDAYSAFQASSHNVKELVAAHSTQSIYVCGLAADYCVKATAIDGASLTKIPVAVIEDATAAVDSTSQWQNELKEAGVRIVNSSDIPSS